MTLLQGPVVFIDDEVHKLDKPAHVLAQNIRATGRPVSVYTELPPIEHAAHWRSIGFLVLDWDLVPGSPGGIGGSTLSAFQRESLFDWLEQFAREIFCPIFVVSAEDTNDIQRQIGENLALSSVVRSGRLAVFAKQTLMDGFVEYLEQWVASKPALTAMNVWANEIEGAMNRLFLDMDALEADWPVYVWRRALDDKIDPSYELASVISANLLHRVNALQFDIPAISSFEGNIDGAAMRKVTQGRTFLAAERLYPTMVLPGDLFADKANEAIVWINVTPACHTVLNRASGPDGLPDPASVRMQLVRGTRLDNPLTPGALNKIRKEQDGPNGMLIHALMGDHPYAFDFRHAEIRSWGEIAEQRVGRLLPPFVTLLQQRHASFLMNEGLPRVDWSLYASN